jgi:hypothetical protein
MTRMLDCLVSYFGIDENDRPTYRRYFCYQVVAGPGPTDEAGIAVVTTLAVHDETERCTSCQKLHAVETGGPEAAIAAAVRYLDSYHERDRRAAHPNGAAGASHSRKATRPVRGESCGSFDWRSATRATNCRKGR